MKTPFPNIKSLADLEIMNAKDLGEGYISKVKLARHRQTNQKYAIKIVN